MHREGHIGVGFFIYSPFAYFFIDAGWTLLFGLGMVAIGAWSFLPDIDMTLPIRHRGPTHSIVFAACAGLLTALVFAWLFTQVTSVGAPLLTMVLVGFSMGFLGVLGHIIGDVLTPMGVQPWWPRSNSKYSLDVVYAADKQANKQLSMLGAVAVTIALIIGEIGIPV